MRVGHEGIIANASRPFRDANHIDSVLIERLWTEVGPEDDLWMVGDFAFGPKAKDEDWLLTIFGQLPGARRHLVVGNHDSPRRGLCPGTACPGWPRWTIRRRIAR